MTCEDVRRALIERPSGPQPDLAEHLEGCAECRALMEEIRMGDEAVGGWIAGFERSGSFDAAWKRAIATPAPAPSYGRTWALAAAALLVAGASFGAGWGASRIGAWSAVGTSEGEQGPSTNLAVALLEPDEEGETAVEVRLTVPEPELEPVAEATIEPEPGATVAVPTPGPLPPAGSDTIAIIRGTPVVSHPEPSATPVSAALEATAGVEPRPVIDESCGDLRALEPAAILGKLTAGQVACLEERYAGASTTDRDKVSRILMANAYSAGDMAGWERLIRRHLDEVSQADPDLDYKLVLYLSKHGGQGDEIIRWANVALSHGTVWRAETRASRVYSLHKLRTAAAQDLWRQAAEAQEAAPSAEGEAVVAAAKKRTRIFAQDWYAFAVEERKETAVAAQLCTAAGGTCAD